VSRSVHKEFPSACSHRVVTHDVETGVYCQSLPSPIVDGDLVPISGASNKGLKS